MRDKSRPDKRSGGGATTIFVVLLLIGLYVASIGPAWGLAARDRIAIEPLQRIYIPLSWVGNRVPAVAHSVDWWMRLWEPNAATQC